MKNKNQFAVVTGASRGIGKSVALKLAELGYDLALLARTESDLIAVKEAIEQNAFTKNIQVKCYTVDVSQKDQVSEAIKKITSEQEKIDLLFNNAGIAEKGTSDIDPEIFEQLIQVNLLGMFYMVHAVAPHMKKQCDGYIINLLSRSGKKARSNMGAYAASKFGAVGYNEALYKELVNFNIKVTAINPGYVNTQMTSKASSLLNEEKIQPEEIADIVEFLLKLKPFTYIKEINLESKPQVINQSNIL